MSVFGVSLKFVNIFLPLCLNTLRKLLKINEVLNEILFALLACEKLKLR